MDALPLTGHVPVEMIYDFETTKSRLIPPGYSTEFLSFASRAVSNPPRRRRDSKLLSRALRIERHSLSSLDFRVTAIESAS